MKTVIPFFLACFVFFPVSVLAQNKIDSLFTEGIRLHDGGKYREAIACFQKILKEDPENSKALCELAYTFMTVKDYERAVKYARKSIRAGRERLPEAYVIWGSSLDELGKRKEAIPVFDEGIALFPEEYLLEYNKGLTLYRMKDFKGAEKTLCRSVSLRPNHPGSHLLLAYTESELQNRVKSLLPLYMFLLVEPLSERSVQAWEILASIQTRGVSKKNPGGIRLNFAVNEDSDSLGVVDIAVSLATAITVSGKADTTELGRFADRNERIFSVISEQKSTIHTIWWKLYMPFLAEVYTSGNTRAFSYYISRAARPDEANAWFETHTDAMNRFADWLGRQQFLR